MSNEREAFVTVGGGNGSPVLNEALLRTNKVDRIAAVGAVYDNGGATGRRRLDSYGQEIAHGDTIRILPSLVSPEEKDTEAFEEFVDLLKHRDERDRSLGQDVFNRYFDETNGLSKIEKKAKAFGINLRGRVLPSSAQSSDITFTTSRNMTYKGEHLFDDLRMSKAMVVDMKLEPEVEAYPPAAEALQQAENIFVASGSIHASVLANFLPKGMVDALRESEAKMFVITNLVSTRNETHEFTPRKFVELIEKYTQRRPDGLIVPDISRRAFESRNPYIADLYADEHSHFLGWEPEELTRFEKQEGIQIFPHAATKIVEGKSGHQVVRHDPEKLSTTLREILPA